MASSVGHFFDLRYEPRQDKTTERREEEPEGAERQEL